MGKTVERLATRMCFPFCSLVMKIMILKGVCPLKEGTTLPSQRPISLLSLQMSKGHSSTEKARKSPPKPPKSESSQRVVHFWFLLMSYLSNNHVQIRLTTIETQLDEIQRKLEESL